MSKWRVELKIQGQIRWLSHLDTLSLVERAFRRAKLPVAYSQGFQSPYANFLGAGTSGRLGWRW